MKVKEFFLKMILMMVVLLSILSFVDIIALSFSIRPQSVLIYVFTGVFASYIGDKIHERVIHKREDPLPEYILRKTRETNKKVEIMEEIIEEHGISKEEIKMRAKLREERGREVDKERRFEEEEEPIKENSN